MTSHYCNRMLTISITKNDDFNFKKLPSNNNFKKNYQRTNFLVQKLTDKVALLSSKGSRVIFTISLYAL